MKRLGLAVAAALAAAVAATVVFDGAEHERARERPPPDPAASHAAGVPAVHDRMPVHAPDPLDGAPERAPSGDADALADAPGLDAASTDAIVAEASPRGGPAPAEPAPRADTAAATTPLDPPAPTPTGPGQREPAAPAATAREADARTVDAAPAAEQARRLTREGIALIDAGRPREAIAPLERAAGLQPRDAEILDKLGDAYLLAGEHLIASRHFMRALDLAPTRSATWINLGRSRAELGQRESAIHAVVTGYQHSTHKAGVRAALLATATGAQYSPQWREVAGQALARIGDR